ncbi:MAG TPA: retron system putative HNH endonuclease [Terracidiphilus sp.]|nr:retron system putative HNH endonuclease [Terracidiphilus sp.]
MRRIIKGPEPPELERWKQENAEIPENLRYSALHGTQTADIKEHLLLEQGYLCGYTMQAISTIDDCHIEHVISQRQLGAATPETLDYSNMIACFPGRRPPYDWEPKYPYGAQAKKDSSITTQNFVSPLTEDVGSRFRYLADGRVESKSGDKAAASTIEILRLDHEALTGLRKAAIEERVLDVALSLEEAQLLAAEALIPGSDGRLPEFCAAVAQVADWYAAQIQAATRRQQ